jgi:hypothetical protein
MVTLKTTPGRLREHKVRGDLRPEIARLPASTQYGGQASSVPSSQRLIMVTLKTTPGRLREHNVRGDLKSEIASVIWFLSTSTSLSTGSVEGPSQRRTLSNSK